MVGSVTDKDLRALVQAVEEGRSTDSEAEPDTDLPSGVLEALRTLVLCDDVTFLELTPTGCDIAHMQAWPQPEVDSIGEVGVDANDPFWTHYWDCDAVSYPSVTGDVRSVTTISDFYSLRQWRDTGMHAEVLRGIKHRIMVCLSAPEGHERRLLLFRTSGSDFDERDRLLLRLLRPHIDELYQHRLRRRLAGSTLRPRQREILALVATGMSNQEIAVELGLSMATVRTHLEHIFDRLDVSNRTAAVAKAFPAPPH
jgi:DNA-binding CsgD family transcriptional regulator